MADNKSKVLELHSKGKSPTKIASETGISINTIKSWIKRSKKSDGVQGAKGALKDAPLKAKKVAPKNPVQKIDVGVVQKNKVGCPPFYKTVDEMEIVIADYFELCKGRLLKDDDGELVYDKKGKPIWVDVKSPTITGLALHLGFNSRQALINYQGKPEFNYTITRAKALCEEYAEQQLYTRDGARGAEFTLSRNFKWKDPSKEREVDLKEREVDLKEQSDRTTENMAQGLEAIGEMLKIFQSPQPRHNIDSE